MIGVTSVRVFATSSDAGYDMLGTDLRVTASGSTRSAVVKEKTCPGFPKT